MISNFLSSYYKDLCFKYPL